MAPTSHRFTFVGRGDRAELERRTDEIRPWGGSIGPWRRHHGDPGVEDNVGFPNHPANYRARQDLADAVNTALALSKPLLLTGNPGTGKSQLAERIAWEFNLGPVLRFEAQSLSEANDLFYRFDLVGHLAAVEMFRIASKPETPEEIATQVRSELATQIRNEPQTLTPQRFVKLGPLGESIVRSDPPRHEVLFDAVFGPGERAATTAPRPSVVLIDEIDKTSRDFPNDLLNGIERLEFRVRELGLVPMEVHPDHRPIVIITSNSERDLPAPFLRRCTFFHIADPTRDELADIVAQRFFAGRRGDGAPGGPKLPPFYQQLLERFWDFREQHQDELQYRPGTSELIDWTAALSGQTAAPDAALADQIDLLRKTASAVSKHKDDHRILREFLEGLSARPA
jgi:MoxR-like ATPase